MTPAEPTPEEVAAVIAVLIATSIAPAPPVTSASAWTTGGRHRRPHPRPAAGGWLASTRQYA